jgi:hypothetical protein
MPRVAGRWVCQWLQAKSSLATDAASAVDTMSLTALDIAMKNQTLWDAASRRPVDQ